MKRRMFRRTSWMVALSFALAFIPYEAQAQQSETPVACNEGSTTLLNFGDHATGCAIDPATDLDIFSFVGSAGDNIRITVLSTTPFDPRLELRDPVGTVIEDTFCATDFHRNLCSFSVEPTLTLSGTYLIAISDEGTNNTGDYLFQIEKIPPAIAPPNIETGSSVSDAIDPATDLDFFTFEAIAGTEIRITMLSTTPFDPRLELRDPVGVVIEDTFCATDFHRNLCSFSVEPTLTLSGTYLIAISDEGTNNTGDYELSLQCLFGPCLVGVSTTTLSVVQLGKSFSQELEAFSPALPFTWSVVDRTLPSGVSLSFEGILSGTPTETGEFTFTVRATDSAGDFAEKEFTLKVLLMLPPPDIRISKTGTTAVPGRVLEYFITVENVGDVTATNAKFTEFLEPWFTFVSANPIPSSITQIEDIFPDPTTGDTYDAFIEWTISVLKPGEVQNFSYKAELDPTFPIGETVIGRFCMTPEEADVCLDGLFQSILVAGLACGKVPIGPQRVACLLGGVLTCEVVYATCMLRANNTCGTNEQITAQPVDPNEKLVIAKKFIQPDQLLVYPIHYENIGDVEALDVFITDVLDPNLDVSTLEVLTPGGDSFDADTRTLKWSLIGRNLLPGETDSVLLSIRPMPGLPSGTEIRNSAEIQFEIFDSLVTPEVVNIIDTTRPECVMDPLPDETTTLNFPISWSGSDAIGEIESFSIFVSEDEETFTPFIERTRDQTATFAGESGKFYEFFCVAEDTAGNVETQLAAAESSTVISTDGVAPDLIPGLTKFKVKTKEDGDKVVAKLTVHNVGASLASGPFTVSMFLSADSVLDDTDELLDSRTIFEDIPPGGSVKIKLKRKQLPPVAGNYAIMVIDADNDVAERSERNNTIACATDLRGGIKECMGSFTAPFR